MLSSYDQSYVSEGLKLFTGDNKKANILALTSAYLEQCQELEDAINAVILSRYLDNAADAQLDLLGKIVGQPRGNDADNTYRAAIRVRILINISKGRTGDIIKIILACAPDGHFYYWDTGNAKYVVTAFGLDPSEVVPLENALAESRPLGIGSDFIFSSSGSASTASNMLLLDTVAGGYVPSVLDTVAGTGNGLLFEVVSL